MQKQLPDYFIALMKQHGGMLNDEQARRAIMAVSEVLESSLTPAQEGQFFAMVPGYLRPHKQTFFARIGAGSKTRKRSSIDRQLSDRLQLTSREEAEMVLKAYFRAIRTVIDPTTAITLTRILPPELVRLYAAT